MPICLKFFNFLSNNGSILILLDELFCLCIVLLSEEVCKYLCLAGCNLDIGLKGTSAV